MGEKWSKEGKKNLSWSVFQGLFLVFDFGYERLNEANEYYSAGPLRAKAKILVVINILVCLG